MPSSDTAHGEEEGDRETHQEHGADILAQDGQQGEAEREEQGEPAKAALGGVAEGKTADEEEDVGDEGHSVRADPTCVRPPALRFPSLGAVAKVDKAPVSKTGDSRFESWLPRLLPARSVADAGGGIRTPKLFRAPGPKPGL